jgi:hypothetical protein
VGEGNKIKKQVYRQCEERGRRGESEVEKQENIRKYIKRTKIKEYIKRKRKKK